MHIPELLAPAGNFERLETALRFGADAVYVGMRQLSLRNFADNFSMDELQTACVLAHGKNKKIYVTVNAFIHNADLRDLPKFLRDIADAGADALIINDPGVLLTAREAVPTMPLHLSTQANTLNAKSAAFWHAQGICRIVLARELSFSEILEIQKQTPDSLEFEIFVHGAMCISYSGRCLLSNYMTNRDSNKGECAQPCRWKYELREAGSDGEFLTIEEDDRGAYLLNSRDLNLLPYLAEICTMGIHSVKIEGRMKSIYYVANVVNAYRMALDEIAAYGEICGGTLPLLLTELEKVSHRPYAAGFSQGNPGAAGQATLTSKYAQSHELCAAVLAYYPEKAQALIEQRNKFAVGDVLDILSPGRINREIEILEMRTEDNQPVSVAPHPQQRLLIPADKELKPGDLLRKKV